MEKPAQFLTPQFFITVLMLGLVGYVLFEVFKGTPPASNDVQVIAAANQALANVVARDTAASPTPVVDGQTQKVEITGVSAEAVADAEKLIAKDR